MTHLELFLQNIRSRGGIRGKLLRVLFKSMLAGFDAAKLDTEACMQETAAQSAKAAEERAALVQQYDQLLETLQTQNDALSQEIAGLQERLARLEEVLQSYEPLCQNVRNNNAQLAALESDMGLCKVTLQGLKRPQAPTVTTVTAAAPPPAEDAYRTIDYFDFENHFRGSIDAIKHLQMQYLPYFSGKHHVLDIGCGRGEFLTLMQEQGIPAKGVDIYQPYVDYCRMQGLDAVCGDGTALLPELGTFDGIFVGQVVEHLRTDQILALCEAAYAALPEGGCLVIETPNPTSLAIYTNAFYIDPSHVKPVHPLTMRYFLEKAGFTRIEVLYTESSRPPQQIPRLEGVDAANLEEFNQAMQEVSHLLYGSQDYAVIAVK